MTTAVERLLHIHERIALIRALLLNSTFSEAWQDQIRWPAFERHLEIISEASRNVPNEWKGAHGPDIEWSKIAGLGSILRHVYHHTSAPILWDIYLNDLDPLEAAIDRMIAAHDPNPPRSPSS